MSICYDNFMRRVVFILVLFLNLASWVRAVEPPPPLTPQQIIEEEKGNPTSHVTMKLGLGDAIEAIENKIFGLSIIGPVIPLVVQQDELNITDMTPFNIYHKPAFRWLMPYSMSTVNPYVPFTTENPESGRYCAVLTLSSEITPTIVLYEVTEPNTVQISQNISWSQFLYTTGQYIGTLWSGFKMEANEEGKLVFDKPRKIVGHISTEDCGIHKEGVQNEQQTLTTGPRAVFGDSAIITDTVPYSIFIEVYNAIKDVWEKVYDTIGIKGEIRITKKARISNSHFAMLHAYGAIGDELAQQVTDNSRTPKEGWASSFVAYAARRNPNGYGGSPNEIILGQEGGTGDIMTANKPLSFINPEAGINKVYQAQKLAACPAKAYQLIYGKGPVKERFKIGGEIPIDDACSQPAPGTDTFGNVCEVAKAYNIPCCQLQGIMAIETEGGANTGSGSCSTSKGNFQCCNGVGCGPAQISCGQYDAFAGKDKLDLCDPVGAAELLARAILLKLCQAAGQCQSYDWTTEGKTALKYKVSDGDYTAAAYFHGLANGCTVSGCTQYRWGAGKGYCDAVENYCTTGQVLPDNTSPEFCVQCNEEVVRSGLPPMQCAQ